MLRWFPTHDGRCPPGSFRRAREGHKTVWEATVSPREDGYWGEVERYEGRVARLHPPTGRWWMGPLPTPEAAMRLVDRFVALWRDPATWRETPLRLPIGDSYTLRVLDAEKALAWPQDPGGVELSHTAGPGAGRP
jgi:hypothetical protein